MAPDDSHALTLLLVALFAVIARFLPGSAELLDDEFKNLYHLTYHTFGAHADVDSAPFRQAIWYYTGRLYGVLNDDYEYAFVNKLLSRAVKTFVKNLVCFPHGVRRRDFAGFAATLSLSEKVHVALLATEARMQLGLLYGLRAVGEYYSKR